MFQTINELAIFRSLKNEVFTIYKPSNFIFYSLLGFYTNNTTLYVGIGITVAMLIAGAAIMFVWCKYKSRPGYSAGRIGMIS